MNKSSHVPLGCQRMSNHDGWTVKGFMKTIITSILAVCVVVRCGIDYFQTSLRLAQNMSCLLSLFSDGFFSDDFCTGSDVVHFGSWIWTDNRREREDFRSLTVVCWTRVDYHWRPRVYFRMSEVGFRCPLDELYTANMDFSWSLDVLWTTNVNVRWSIEYFCTNFWHDLQLSVCVLF